MHTLVDDCLLGVKSISLGQALQCVLISSLCLWCQLVKIVRLEGLEPSTFSLQCFVKLNRFVTYHKLFTLCQRTLTHNFCPFIFFQVNEDLIGLNCFQLWVCALRLIAVDYRELPLYSSRQSVASLQGKAQQNLLVRYSKRRFLSIMCNIQLLHHLPACLCDDQDRYLQEIVQHYGDALTN